MISAVTAVGVPRTVKFFLLTYVISWSCWIAAIGISGPKRFDDSVIPGILLLAGTFAPALCGLMLTAYAEGKPGVMSMLSRMLQGGVGLRWFLFAILYMPIIKGMVALSYRLATGTWPPFGHESALVIAAAILFSTPVQAGEEIGWRGYALPRIASRLGLGWASVIVGLIWGVWHLPLFFWPGSDKYNESFPLYVAGVIAFSVAIAWLYGHTGGSLLMTMLMHSAFNQTIGIVDDRLASGEKPFALGAALSFILTIAWMWVAAAFFLSRMPRLPASAEPPGGAEIANAA